MAGTPISDIALFSTVHTRLAADTALVSLIGTDIYMDPAPTGSAVTLTNPIRVVYRGELAFSDPGTTPTTQTSLGLEAVLQVGVQFWREQGSTGDVAAAILRVMGDYDPSDHTAPTYGLHQWSSSVTGWTFQPWLIQRSFTTAISDEVVETLYEFECIGEMS